MEMEMEATILERLEELCRWQSEQQERLLKQQQEQRALLSMEQERMYEVLGLSVQSIVLDDSLAMPSEDSSVGGQCLRTNFPEISICELSGEEDPVGGGEREKSIHVENLVTSDEEENSGKSIMQLSIPKTQLTKNRYCALEERFLNESVDQRTPVKFHGCGNEIDGIEPLGSPVKRKILALDDMPVPSPRKDFSTMVEEKLRDFEAENGREDKNKRENGKPVIKRPFLRKGEGLARFKPNSAPKNRCTRPRSASLSSNTNSGRNGSMKHKETPKSSKIHGSSNAKSLVPLSAQAKLSLKNIAAPKNKVRSKSLSSVSPGTKSMIKAAQATIDMNLSSDNETKARRELEEMRIFELLEEKAENSSFCSNSSTIMALFRQSTPRKIEEKVTPRKHQEAKDDAIIEEAIRTSKSNIPGSPIAKIRQTVIQKDYVFSNFNESSNEQSSQNTNRASYKATQHTKHTTIQFGNNNYNSFTNNNNNNNNNIDKEANISETETGDSPRKNGKSVEKRPEDVEKIETNGKLEVAARTEGNTNLRVRFSEYNEYKTLTDTSMISNDSCAPRNYRDEKAWSDRSTSPDSSDVEILFSKRQNFTDDRATTEDEEDEYETTCEESSACEGDKTMTEMEMKELNNSSSEEEQEEGEDKNAEGKILDAEATTKFKSELLKTRLAELEREIEIFRKENASLAKEREDLKGERLRLATDYREKELNIKKDKAASVERLETEKRRLVREKTVLTNRLRDAREKSSLGKLERQELQTLRDKLEEMREETNEKENRWMAAQARQKSQIRVLQTENSKLKQELEKIRATKTNNSRQGKKFGNSNTRLIHQINKQLDAGKQNGLKGESNEEKIPDIDEDYGNLRTGEPVDIVNLDDVATEINHEQEVANSDEDLLQKKNMYANLLSEAEQGLYDCEEIILTKKMGDVRLEENCDKMGNSKNFAQEDEESVKSEQDLLKKRNMYENLLSEATQGLRGCEEIMLGKKAGDRRKSASPRDRTDFHSYAKNWQEKSEVHDKSTKFEESREIGNTSRLPVPQWGRESRANLQNDRSNDSIMQKNRSNKSPVNKQDIREIKCPDGHIEHWYRNGNVKKMYPDRKVTKMIYYNGDVRESQEDGSVKYFYASTNTWHTTMPDGLEILEFPDGQVEKRGTDGSNEVHFPDGSVRLLQPDGTEKWILQDGTVAKTYPDGNKILSFPNGQREVHTKEHKRREYPDGTVKFVYPDGTQETRYSTGRVRVKDKDGNLLVDVHHR